jgi:uncharacterized protein
MLDPKASPAPGTADQAVVSQAEVLAFLAAPSTRGGAPVRRIDTHLSAVFLAGDRALKVKRAVRLPFLDYSSLDQRRAACAAELEINRRFAPDLYRGVVPISRKADGGLAVGGSGAAVEWAVEMRRFDETRTLDRVAAAEMIDPAVAEALGQVTAAAHAAIVEAEPWIAALDTYLDQNQGAFAQTPELLPQNQVAILDDASRQALGRLRPLLRARGELGLIRRGHGDLHLGNIAWIDGRPVPFDAMVFDQLIASGDVLYALAFLLMDFVERGLGAAANIVLNRYLWESRRPQDLDELAALPRFLSLRAAIRAKVTAARLATATASQRPGLAQSARTYFGFAGAFIAPRAPTLVAIGGLSGTGKSVLARALAPDVPPAPGAVVLSSDRERKVQFAVAETERLAADAYGVRANAAVYTAPASKARRVLAAGHSVAVDAVFARPEDRRLVKAAAADRRFCGIFLQAELATRIRRVGDRAGDVSDADAALAAQQEAYDFGPLNWARIDASGSPARTLAAARAVRARRSPAAGEADDNG